MSHPRQVPVFKPIFIIFLLWSLSPFVGKLSAQAPTPPEPPSDTRAKSDSPAKPAQTSGASDNQEVSSRDTPTTFRVRVNLVLVRVVVRDAHGKVVPNLKKEDFQLLDNRKLQTISSFTIETPETHALSAAVKKTALTADPANADAVAAKPVVLPQRFVSMVFDDIHMSMEDTTFVRDSATRFFGAMAPSDRVSLNSTSGQFSQDFTDDHEVLQKALLRVIPHPLGNNSFHNCPEISYYQADLILNKNDSQALAVATEDAIQCAFQGDETQTVAAQAMAIGAAGNALAEGDNQSQYAFRHLDEIVYRLTTMPGQRVLVFVSPGFIPSTLQYETSDMVDRANRANIVINTIDARGLYVPDLAGDIANPPRDSFRTAGYKTSYRVMAQSAQDEVMAEMADGTGGRFFHNRNDVDEAMREAGAAPPLSYLLGFSPQNLKIDGRYHTLKVSLTGKAKFSVQARHGYYAPRTIADPAEAAKQEIQEALFSQDEIRDLPVDLQTQFFKKGDTGARLAVLTHFDLTGIRFRKAEGRNRDDLTIVTGIFDENGNYVTGGQKIVEMKLLDTTYDRLSHSGLTVKSSFDVKPGTYLVRLVVRDSEGAQMAARNGAVVIPY